MSLQNPAVRPSMMVRAVSSKRITATTTSCASRALASVRPTWAYSGSVKLTDDFARARKQPGIVDQRLAHVDPK